MSTPLDEAIRRCKLIQRKAIHRLNEIDERDSGDLDDDEFANAEACGRVDGARQCTKAVQAVPKRSLPNSLDCAKCPAYGHDVVRADQAESELRAEIARMTRERDRAHAAGYAEALADVQQQLNFSTDLAELQSRLEALADEPRGQ